MDQPHATDIVAWIGKAKARSEDSQVIFDVVVRRRLKHFGEVIDAVAAELLSRDCQRAGMDVAVTERLRAAYIAAARHLVCAQDGRMLRIVPSRTLPLSHVEHPAATKGGWRRPVGLYVALGGFLAAFQHVVQRHLFQARSLDVSSGLVLIVYVVIGALGVHWFRCAYARVEDMPAQRTETTSS